MDNRNVSTIGIGEGIDYLGREFIAKLDEQTEQAIQAYTSLQAQGILSSATIDGITNEIKAKVSQLQNNFDTLAMQLKKDMGVSQENITMERTAIENELGQGR